MIINFERNFPANTEPKLRVWGRVRERSGGLLSRNAGAEAGEPAVHRRLVAAVRIAEAALQRRFLVKPDEEVQEQEIPEGQPDDRRRPQEHAAAEENAEAADVHRVAHV